MENTNFTPTFTPESVNLDAVIDGINEAAEAAPTSVPVTDTPIVVVPMDPTPTTKPGLSTGAKVGIVAGIVALIGGIAAGIFFWRKKKKANKPAEPAQPTTESAPKA